MCLRCARNGYSPTITDTRPPEPAGPQWKCACKAQGTGTRQHSPTHARRSPAGHNGGPHWKCACKAQGTGTRQQSPTHARRSPAGHNGGPQWKCACKAQGTGTRRRAPTHARRSPAGHTCGPQWKCACKARGTRTRRQSPTHARRSPAGHNGGRHGVNSPPPHPFCRCPETIKLDAMFREELIGKNWAIRLARAINSSKQRCILGLLQLGVGICLVLVAGWPCRSS